MARQVKSGHERFEHHAALVGLVVYAVIFAASLIHTFSASAVIGLVALFFTAAMVMLQLHTERWELLRDANATSLLLVNLAGLLFSVTIYSLPALESLERYLFASIPLLAALSFLDFAMLLRMRQGKG